MWPARDVTICADREQRIGAVSVLSSPETTLASDQVPAAGIRSMVQRPLGDLKADEKPFKEVKLSDLHA
jgi:hypothetical protein